MRAPNQLPTRALLCGPSNCTGVQATRPCLGDRLRQREVETLVDCLSHAGIRAVQHFTKCTAGLVFRLAEQLTISAGASLLRSTTLPPLLLVLSALTPRGMEWEHHPAGQMDRLNRCG